MSANVCRRARTDSTSPTAFVRSRASQAAGTDGLRAQKMESVPHLWGQGLGRHNLCRCVQQYNLVQAVSLSPLHHVVVVDLPLLCIAVEGPDNPIILKHPCQTSLPPD